MADGHEDRRARHAGVLRQRHASCRARSRSRRSRRAIDEELAKAEALVKTGTPKAKVYAEIMKDAADGAAAAGGRRRREPGAEPEPDQDETVHQVEAGKAPVARAQERPHHHGGVLRLPVPVLQPGRADHRPAGEGIPGQDPGGVEGLPAQLPPERQARRPSPPGWPASRASSGRCTRSCSRTRRRSIGASLEKYAAGAGAGRGQVEGGAGQQQVRRRHRRRHGGRARSWGCRARRPRSSTAARSAGAYPYETFKKIVDQELAKAKKRS